MFDKEKKKKDPGIPETEEFCTEDLTAQELLDGIDDELQAESAEEFSELEAEFDEDMAEDDSDPLAKELEAQKDSYLRLAAEYDNFRKRTVREKEALTAEVRAGCYAALLPVIDNLERAAAAGTGSPDALQKGIEMVLSQASSILENLGVTPYGAPGDEFDPNIHHCVSTAPSEDYDTGKITIVMQKGYKLGDRVIRPAMVQTAE